MKISYLSDLHLDFHVKFIPNQQKWEARTRQFIRELISTDEDNHEVLVLAGDLSHYNKQSVWAVDEFAKFYDVVFVQIGNHDYYLISKNQENKYKSHSVNRVNELEGNLKNISNVKTLFNGETFNYRGVKFGGCPMWYPLDNFEQESFFYNVSNDSKLIKGSNVELLHARDQEYYEELLKEEIDVMISHFPVINIDSHFKYNSTACYLTRVIDINAKAWIMAHSHEQKVYKKPYCTFYMNAIGYPEECLELKIESFHIRGGEGDHEEEM